MMICFFLGDMQRMNRIFSFFPLIPGLQCLRKFASYLWVVFIDLCTQFNLKVQNQRLWASLQAGEVGSASQQAMEYLKSLLSTGTTEQARHPTAEAECFGVHGHDKQEEENCFLLIPETLVWILHQVLKGGVVVVVVWWWSKVTAFLCPSFTQHIHIHAHWLTGTESGLCGYSLSGSMEHDYTGVPAGFGLWDDL